MCVALSLHRLHVTPLLRRGGLTGNVCKLSATLNLHRLHRSACRTIPAQERSDMQAVQTECRTQFVQIACHAILVQEWYDMQSVQAECPNVDRLRVGDLFGSDAQNSHNSETSRSDGRTDRSPSLLPRHASELNWTGMLVSELSWERCHRDRRLRFVSLL